MYRLLCFLLLFGPGLAVPAAFAGLQHPAEEHVDPRDQAFCQLYLAPPDELHDERFAADDPLTRAIPRLVDLLERNERTHRSLNQADRVRQMADVAFEDVADFARAHAGKPMPLDQVYRAYLDAAWLKNTHFVRAVNPNYFADERGYAPESYEAFILARMVAFRERYPQRLDVGPVLTRLVNWLPDASGERLKALELLGEVAPSHALLGDLLLGGDPLRALRRELTNERVDDQSPLGIGARRDDIYPDYADLELVIEQLGRKKGRTLVDLTAGIGRLGFALAAHATGLRYVGYDAVQTRVSEGVHMAAGLNLKTSEFQLYHDRVAAPDFDLPKADIYYLSNAFFPSELDQIYRKLARRAAEGDQFTVIMGYEPLFRDAATLWPDEHAAVAGVFPPLPAFLDLTWVLHAESKGYDAPFYFFKSRRR